MRSAPITGDIAMGCSPVHTDVHRTVFDVVAGSFSCWETTAAASFVLVSKRSSYRDSQPQPASRKEF